MRAEVRNTLWGVLTLKFNKMNNLEAIESQRNYKDEKLIESIYSQMVGIAQQLERMSSQVIREETISAIVEYLDERFQPIDA